MKQIFGISISSMYSSLLNETVVFTVNSALFMFSSEITFLGGLAIMAS